MNNPFNRPMFRKKAMAKFGPQGILASSPELMTAVQRAKARQQPVRAQAGLSVNMDVADLSPRGLNSRDLIGYVRSQMDPADPNFNSIANMPRARLVDLAESYLSRASGATDRGAQPVSVGKAIPDASRGVQVPGMAVSRVSGPSDQNAGILATEAGRDVSSIVETGLPPSEAAVSPRPDSASPSNLPVTGATGEGDSVPSVSETLAGDLPRSGQPPANSKFLSDVAVAKSGFADSEVNEDEQAANAAKNDASAGISSTGTDGKPKPFSDLVQDRYDFLKTFVGEEEAEEVKDDLRTSFGYNMVMGALRMAADDDVDRGAAFARAFGTQLGEFGAVRGEERKAERKRKDTARAEDRALKLAAVSQVVDDDKGETFRSLTPEEAANAGLSSEAAKGYQISNQTGKLIEAVKTKKSDGVKNRYDAASKVIELQEKLENDEQLSKSERQQLNFLRADLAKPRLETRPQPDGSIQTVQVPGIDVNQVFGSLPSEGVEGDTIVDEMPAKGDEKVVGKKVGKFTVPESDFISAAQSAQADLQTVINIMFNGDLESGEYNKGLAVASDFAAGRALSGEAQRLYDALLNLVDLRLRKRTGATATQEEVDRYMDSIIPGLFTRDDTARERIRRLITETNSGIEAFQKGRDLDNLKKLSISPTADNQQAEDPNDLGEVVL